MNPWTLTYEGFDPQKESLREAEAARTKLYSGGELFIFPHPNLRIPVLTRSLLLYRYRRLNCSRLAAQLEGFKGALYPWQSGSPRWEETQQLHLNPKSGRWLPDHTHLQRHGRNCRYSAALLYGSGVSRRHSLFEPEHSPGIAETDHENQIPGQLV